MTVTRLNTIAYAGLTLGAGTSYDLHDVHLIDGDYSTTLLTFKVVVEHQTDATFKSLCDALVAAWETPFRDLAISIGGTTWQSFSHSANTGFNANPKIRLVGSHRSNNSRCYQCEVGLQKPSTLSGKNGQSSADIQIDTDNAGLLTLTVSAEYTALPANEPDPGDAARSATEVIDEFFDDYLDDVKALDLFSGITFDSTAARSIQRQAEDKVATVRKVLREILDAESEGATDAAAIVRPEYTVEVQRSRERSGRGSQPLSRVLITYQASVDKDESTDLEDVYTNTIKPKVRAKARELFDGEQTIVVERPIYDPRNNRVFALLGLAVAEESLLAITVTTEDSTFHGVELVPVADGRRFTKDRHQGPGLRFRQIVLDVFALASGADRTQTNWRAPFDDAIRAAQAEGYWLKSEVNFDDGDEVPLEFGLEDGQRVVLRSRTALLEYGVVDGGAEGGGRVGNAFVGAETTYERGPSA